MVGWQTKSFNDFSVTAQLIAVSQLVDDYDDLKHGENQGGRGNYPVVVDPNFFGVHQLFVDWTGLADTRIRAGRQAVTLDDGRFIGTSGLRQLMRSFDGVSVENKSLANTEIYVAHFQDFIQPTTQVVNGKVEIAHATYKFSPSESVTAYGYFLDHTVSDSSRTLGLRLDGGREINPEWMVLYTAEYAKQDDYQDGSSKIDAHFIHVGAGAAWGDWAVRLDREVFSSNKGLYAFQTPTGNSHQGAGDLFVVLPSDGVVDTALSVNGKLMDVRVSAAYHWLDSDHDFNSGASTGDEYGKEFDLGLGYVINKQFTAGIDYVDFREGDVRTAGAFPDVKKLWLTLMYEY